jgi:hypothetical protein
MFRLIFIFLLLITVSCGENGQKKPLNKTDTTKAPLSKYDFRIDYSCAFDGPITHSKVYAFSSDIEAEEAMKKIMRLIGLPSNFSIKAANVPNACAVIYGNKRFILYNQEFMEKIKDDTRTHFSELAILAHEIAHHLSGHTLSSVANQRDAELDADKFAGFILFKLGATIEQAKKAFSLLPKNGSATHPPRDARLAAVTNGYFEAKRNGEIPQANAKQNTSIKKTIQEDNIIPSKESKDSRIKSIFQSSGTCNCKFTQEIINESDSYLADLTLAVQEIDRSAVILIAHNVEYYDGKTHEGLYNGKSFKRNFDDYERVIFKVNGFIQCKGCRTSCDFELLEALRYEFE